MAKSNEFIRKIYEFAYIMNSLVNEFIYSKRRKKIHHRCWTMYQLSLHTLPHHHQLVEHRCFLQYLY
jgi:hypothetical protein